MCHGTYVYSVYVKIGTRSYFPMPIYSFPLNPDTYLIFFSLIPLETELRWAQGEHEGFPLYTGRPLRILCFQLCTDVLKNIVIALWNNILFLQ